MHARPVPLLLLILLLPVLALAPLGATVLGAEDTVEEDELDKPGKAAVPRPTALPPRHEPKKDAEEAKPDAPKKVNPFRRRTRKPKYAEPARVTYSDGTVLEGWTWRRANGPIRIFNRADRAHEDFFLSDLKRIDVRPETVNFEPDWRWKNQGSSVKVFLDVGYFWNQYVTKFSTHEGETIEGDCSGQFYFVTVDGEKKKWVLYKRQSGRDVKHAKKEDLEPLVHVKSVEFTDDFLKRLEEEQKKAEEAAKQKQDGADAATPDPKAP